MNAWPLVGIYIEALTVAASSTKQFSKMQLQIVVKWFTAQVWPVAQLNSEDSKMWPSPLQTFLVICCVKGIIILTIDRLPVLRTRGTAFVHGLN